LGVGIVWFRQDLRLADNPALKAALARCDSILPVFIDDPSSGTLSQIGEATRVWLHHSLKAFDESLQAAGSKLLIVQGDPVEVLTHMAQSLNADGVFWNRSYDPVSIERDKRVKSALKDHAPESHLGTLLFEPVNTLKADETPYRVFTPYWKNLMHTLPGAAPLAAPRNIASPDLSSVKKKLKKPYKGVSLDALELIPDLDWAETMMAGWEVGERAAKKTLKKFLSGDVRHYQTERDIPSVKGTSKMSPHLHFGEISPRQIVAATFGKRKKITALNLGEETFVKEVVWREFAHNLIYQFPHTIDQPLDKRFKKFPWAKKYQTRLRAWQTGQTGVPIIDAGMRELWATGWMHNRVRMVVASYLIKNLLIPWQEGERWFRHTLVDADVASNAMGWQWAAGSGADAAPFFRVFNPVLQGEKFDAEGKYVRQWVPELANVPLKMLHKPWELSDIERAALDYPEPLVDLKVSRLAALDAKSSTLDSLCIAQCWFDSHAPLS